LRPLAELTSLRSLNLMRWLIQAGDENLRLKLKAEIAKRIKRIDIDFEWKERDGVRHQEATITF
jgi:hypothetical protein